MKQKIIKISNFKVANNLPLTLIAGPCQLESQAHAFKMVDRIQSIAKKLKINFIYKTSFDKAIALALMGKEVLALKSLWPYSIKLKKNLKYQF